MSDLRKLAGKAGTTAKAKAPAKKPKKGLGPIPGDHELMDALREIRRDHGKNDKIMNAVKAQAKAIYTGRGNPVDALREARENEKFPVKLAIDSYLKKAYPYVRLYATDAGLDYIMEDRQRLRDVLMWLLGQTG